MLSRDDAVVEGADDQRHDAKWTVVFEQILQKDHFKLDGMLREVRQ